MSNYIIKSPLLVDLSTEQQQFITGGQSETTNLGNTPATVGNGVFGDGFPNTTGNTPLGASVFGAGFPNPNSFNPFGGNSRGNVTEKINSHQNNAGIVLY